MEVNEILSKEEVYAMLQLPGNRMAADALVSSHEALRAENKALKENVTRGAYSLLRQKIADDMAGLAAKFPDKPADELVALIPDALIATPTACHALVSTIAVRLKEATSQLAALTAERDGLADALYHKTFFEVFQEHSGATWWEAETISEHFNEDGSLKGEGKWRARSIFNALNRWRESERVLSEKLEALLRERGLLTEKTEVQDAQP